MTRIQVTFDQLERFEAAHHELVHAAVPEGIDPLIRQAEIDALASVAGDLREELSAMVGGANICTERHPAGPEDYESIFHAAARAGGGVRKLDGSGLLHMHCPRCGFSYGHKTNQYDIMLDIWREQ